jgi:hypothetical protein
MDEDNGVLGNLPRSRPGTRSQKRDAPARAARSAEKRGAKAARPPRQAAQSRPKPPPPRAPAPQGSDPVGDAVRGAAKAAGAGLKLADGVTRGILRRLPRP